MNQILSTDISGNKKRNKNSKPIEINNIVKFFAIAIIIFGIFIIGIGAYSIIDYQKEQQEENIEPTIQIENKTNTTINNGLTCTYQAVSNPNYFKNLP